MNEWRGGSRIERAKMQIITERLSASIAPKQMDFHRAQGGPV